jgi:hypothetical protein
MGNVIEFRRECTHFDPAQALKAARFFPGMTQLVCTILISATSENGTVLMKAEEIGRRAHKSRVTVLPHVRTIVKSGVLERDVKYSFAYRWNAQRVAELAQGVADDDERCAEKSTLVQFSSPARTIWIEAYRGARQQAKGYRMPGNVGAVGLCEPKPEGWAYLQLWLDRVSEILGRSVEVVARKTCEVFFSERGERLVQERHPLAFLPLELKRNDRIERQVRFALTRASSAPEPLALPPSSGGFSGAREALAAIGGAR